jgi:hypothetical protein
MRANLPDGRTLAVTNLGDKRFRVTVARLGNPKIQHIQSATVEGVEELGDWVQKHAPGAVTLTVCMTCGCAVRIQTGAAGRLSLSHGYCAPCAEEAERELA